MYSGRCLPLSENFMSNDDELEKIKAQMIRKMLSPTPPSISVWNQGRIIELFDHNFNQMLMEADVPVLVDFWADWCGPCKMMAPVIEKLAVEYKGRIGFGKLNTDQNQLTSRRFGVMSIPNFIMFSKGKPVDQVIGAVGRPGLEAMIRRHLSQ